MNKISFIGLGKLGLPLASILAKKNKVLCIDKNEYVLSKLNGGSVPFYETGLIESLDAAKENIIDYTDSYYRAVTETDAAIILVNTQIGDNGYSAEFVKAAICDIAVNLKKTDKEYFNIILSSTVLPGTIFKELIPLMETVSGRKYGVGFGFSYVPDFVKLGSVIEDFKNPEFFVIGANNDRDYESTHSIFNGIHENDCDHFRLTLEETEVAKVSLNAFIVNKITFANFLGMMCDEMENVNVHNVTSIIGLDRRISTHFFNSGTPYGGTCFPRDALAFIKFAKDRKLTAKNLIFAQEVNEQLQDYIFRKCSKYEKVGVIGVSFKPTSPVTIGSPSKILIESLIEDGKDVYLYDKLEESYTNLGLDTNQCETAQECIDQSDIVVLMHPDKDFSKLNYENVKVVDLWGLKE
jgi:nucleotide sugar dehydrogenase